MQDFKHLLVWQKAHNLTLLLYKQTTKFPQFEIYGLTSQIRRCSASIGANIAEGTGRKGHAEFHRFLQMANGSTNELEYHLILSRDLGFIGDNEHRELTDHVVEIRKMLCSLINRVSEQREHPRIASTN
jgi:four helix bundle protein